MFEGDMLSSMPSFPHYNIVKTDKNKYDIEIALAGYSKKDIEVNLEEGVLSIKSKKEDKEETKDGEVLHKGIAKRYFSKSFTIADDVEVKGAELKDGLLKVSMERIIPDHKKPRNIAIK
jgi:molecular chaperone IbpA